MGNFLVEEIYTYSYQYQNADRDLDVVYVYCDPVINSAEKVTNCHKGHGHRQNDPHNDTEEFFRRHMARPSHYQTWHRQRRELNGCNGLAGMGFQETLQFFHPCLGDADKIAEFSDQSDPAKITQTEPQKIAGDISHYRKSENRPNIENMKRSGKRSCCSDQGSFDDHAEKNDEITVPDNPPVNGIKSPGNYQLEKVHTSSLDHISISLLLTDNKPVRSSAWQCFFSNSANSSLALIIRE